MFSKVLVANRGEISVRVLQTLQAMGITTVSVFSDPDANAPHVSLADEAYPLGGSTAEETYLDRAKIIDIAVRCGVEAVHPGYGFLAENAAFADALADDGVTFIGPGAKAIIGMGDKITSKKIAAAASVTTIPGFADTINRPEHAVKIARQIGYPVMLKASAGGGGKGMRVVANDEEARHGFEPVSYTHLTLPTILLV